MADLLPPVPGAPTEYRILGPIEALRDGVSVPLGGSKQRAVLAILLSRCGETVPTTRLIDQIWSDDPPATAPNVLQGYISALRKELGKDAIATRGGGYAIFVDDGAFDLRQFERHAAAGSEALAEGRPGEASAAFGAGLALWRGPSLADLAGEPFARPIAGRLDELRLIALERRIEADLECGRSADVVAELEALTAEHPLRERLRALQMLALYRSGRQTESLEVYRRARAAMVEQAGIEPGPALQALEQAILRQDPSLAGPDTDHPRSGAAPAGRAVFVASLELARLDALIAIGEPLAAHGGRELMLAHTVSEPDDLNSAATMLYDRRAALLAHGVETRAAVFTSRSPGKDLARLAQEQDADLLIVDAPAESFDDARLLALLADAPCDVAVHFGGTPLPGPILVPFSGADHDWAAIELGAWLAAAWGVPLHLAGTKSDADGRDASRLLASASLAVQRTLGIPAEPLLVEPTPQALVAAASKAGIVAIGLSGRWQQAGLGASRTALTRSVGPPTLLVRRGLRPGGLAPRAAHTRFTWTLLPGSS
jgi:DNA-binding SARP family transcriptional activator